MPRKKTPKTPPQDEPSDKEDKLAVLIKSRQYVRQRVTNIYNQMSNPTETLSETKKRLYLDKLFNFKSELSVLDKEIYGQLVSDEADDEYLQEKIAEDEEYEEKILYSIEALQSSVSRLYQMPENEPVFTNKLKLPQISLPQYSDSNESLEKFLYSFESIVSKHKLSSYEKYVYLRGQLTKTPRVLIDSLDIQEQNYEKAKELLIDAFGSETVQKFDAIKKLSNLKLGDSTDPYTFIGDVRSVMCSFENLNVDIETMLQYFVWNAMNDQFQSQLVSITNQTRPDIKEIMDNIFVAAERYRDLTNKNRSRRDVQKEQSVTRPRTVNYAVNIDSSTLEGDCILCKGKHKVRECSNYSDPSSKLSKLRELGGCIKCGFLGHKSFHCKYKFKSKCRLCQKDHMTFLCINEQKGSINGKGVNGGTGKPVQKM